MPEEMEGVYPDFMLKEFIEKGFIIGKEPITDDAIGPSSLDLTLGDKAYMIPGSLKPGKNRKVEDMLAELSKSGNAKELDLTKPEGVIFEKDKTYIVELNESLNLKDELRDRFDKWIIDESSRSPRLIHNHLTFYTFDESENQKLPYDLIVGRTNTKSTAGRNGIFARVVIDYSDLYDYIPIGYEGKIYLEINPSTFNIILRKNYPLSQLRLLKGYLWINECKSLLDTNKFIDIFGNKCHAKLPLAIDTSSNIVGYKARKDITKAIDISKRNFYPAEEYWEPVKKQNNGYVILEKNDFYIMVSKRVIAVPYNFALELESQIEARGEVRIHYASMVHPGVGFDKYDKPIGNPLIFEIRPRDTSVMWKDGDMIAELNWYEMLKPPEKPYNKRNNNYNNQGLKLAACFRDYPLYSEQIRFSGL